MRLKGLFWIFAVLLLAIWAVISYYVLYTVSIGWFFAVESLIALSNIVRQCGQPTATVEADRRKSVNRMKLIFFVELSIHI